MNLEVIVIRVDGMDGFDQCIAVNEHVKTVGQKFLPHRQDFNVLGECSRFGQG
jgi:hypothetical protein